MIELWIPLAIGAYLLFALNGVADKFLLTSAVKKPVVYAFFIGITGPLTLVMAPFGLKMLSLNNLLIALIGGACFPIALYFNYSAIQKTSISRVLPILGGFVPIYTLALAYFILGERLNSYQLVALIFLVIGAIFISFRKEQGHWHSKALGNAMVAAMFFALSFTLEKYIFEVSDSFVTGLVWTRIGFFLASISFLIPRANRRAIFNAPKDVSNPNKLLYYGARLSGGAAGLMQNYAIRLGSVTLINALQGTQYLFLLALTSLLSLKFPKILHEKVTTQTITQKIIAIVIISFGLVFLAL